MQLLRERDVPAANHDRVYRYSRPRAAVAYGLSFIGCAVLFGIGVDQLAAVLEFAAILFAGCLLLARRLVTARFRSSNWLVRANENGLYLHFRLLANNRKSLSRLVRLIPLVFPSPYRYRIGSRCRIPERRRYQPHMDPRQDCIG